MPTTCHVINVYNLMVSTLVDPVVTGEGRREEGGEPHHEPDVHAPGNSVQLAEVELVGRLPEYRDVDRLAGEVLVRLLDLVVGDAAVGLRAVDGVLGICHRECLGHEGIANGERVDDDAAGGVLHDDGGRPAGEVNGAIDARGAV
eukprot:86324-Rhodomonas_salina.3